MPVGVRFAGGATAGVLPDVVPVEAPEVPLVGLEVAAGFSAVDELEVPSAGFTLGELEFGCNAEAVAGALLAVSLFVTFVSLVGLDCPNTGPVTANANSIIRNKVLHKRIMDPLQPHSERAPRLGVNVPPLCSSKPATANSNQ
jgi:hypothetical protein